MSASGKRDYKKALNLIQNGKEKKALSLLKNISEGKRASRAIRAASLAKLSQIYYERGKWGQSRKYARAYLREVNDQLIDNDDRPRSAMSRVKKLKRPSRLTLENYYRLGNLYKKKYRQKGERKDYLLGILYFTAAKNFSFKTTKTISGIRSLKKLKKSRVFRKKRPKRSWRVSSYSKRKKPIKEDIKVKNKFSFFVSKVSWQEDRVGEDAAGTQYFLLANTNLNSFGLSYRDNFFGNWLYQGDLSGFKGEANLASSESNLSFSSNDNDITGFQVSLSLLRPFYKEFLTMGLGMQILSRKATWNGVGSATSSTSSEPGIVVDAENLSVIGFFLDIEASYKVSQTFLGFFSRIGQGSAFSSAYWQLGIKYYLY